MHNIPGKNFLVKIVTILEKKKKKNQPSIVFTEHNQLYYIYDVVISYNSDCYHNNGKVC